MQRLVVAPPDLGHHAPRGPSGALEATRPDAVVRVLAGEENPLEQRRPDGWEHGTSLVADGRADDTPTEGVVGPAVCPPTEPGERLAGEHGHRGVEVAQRALIDRAWLGVAAEQRRDPRRLPGLVQRLLDEPGRNAVGEAARADGVSCQLTLPVLDHDLHTCAVAQLR